MKQVRVALAQINPTVGALSSNGRRITEAIEEARSVGAGLVVFPELAVTGYPPEDLLLKPDFLKNAQATLRQIARAATDCTALVGTPDSGDRLHNAAAVLHSGEIQGYVRKQLLPNYGVFDEERYFAAGRASPILDSDGLGVAASICEDIWYPDGPVTYQAREGGAGLMVNLSASPFERGKVEQRERMLATRAADNRAFLAFCNLVGGQDELVFDGHSVILDPSGEVVARAPGFTEDLLVADIDFTETHRRRLREPRKPRMAAGPDSFETISIPTVISAGSGDPERPESPPCPDREAVYRAAALGLRDYVQKSGFENVIVGLSGGIDSALTVALAADALGPANVTAVTMPTRYSSEGSVTDSQRLASALGVDLVQIDIDELRSDFAVSLADAHESSLTTLTKENLQPRIRGTLLMGMANQSGSLVVTTGNKSELAVGYATLYGDTAGAFAVLKDISKTLVYRLAQWRNDREDGPVIPQNILEKPPSAELRPDQQDTDALPPYEILDPILQAYIEDGYSVDEIARLGYQEETVDRVVSMVDQAEYKRRQYPPGPKITGRAFGKDWRLPIVNAYTD